MSLLVDAFGFLTVILRGLAMVAQAATLGGIAFLLLLVYPLEPLLDAAGPAIRLGAARLLRWSGVAFAVVTLLSMAGTGLILADTVGLGLRDTLGASFMEASGAVAMAALGVAWIARDERPPALPLLVLVALILVAQTMTSHAAARIDDRLELGLAELLHQAGAAVWLGGIPYLIMALARCPDGKTWRRVGKRFSQMAIVAVATIVVAGVYMAVAFTGSWEAFYGTSYGIMIGGKIAMLLMLLALGGMNFLLIDRLRDGTGALERRRVRSFAEAEIGIGITLLLAAASLTSLPPAGDLARQDIASLQEIVERLTPTWPRLESPDHAALAISQLQSQLDAEASANEARPQAFVPGAGELPPRNAQDIAWSEYNHHWAGLIVLAIGILAVLERTGRAPWARNWPLLFMVLAAFLFLRSDPETWPLGDVGFWESFRDPEVLQHRLFVFLIVPFAIFEWRVRTGRTRSEGAALVFPLVTALGGALLLAHAHALSNVKDLMLIEMSHLPLGLIGVLAGWTRWLELRLDPPAGRIAAAIWPVCLVLAGLLLLSYREA